MNETPLFFSNQGSRLFGVRHDPEDEDRQKAFVFCHPFAEEKLWAHRVFVTFARELAALGYTVLRFDYRGYGDSEGEFADMTAESYLEDIEAAIAFLRSETSVTNEIGLLGYRLGATLALHSARRLRTCGPLILWDPVRDGERAVQEFLRSHLTTQLAIYGEIRQTREQLLERMKAGERINVDGYDLSAALYDSIAALTMLEVEGSADDLKCPTLLVQIGKTEKPTKESVLQAEGLGASLLCVVEEPFWREIKRFYYRAEKLFDATIEWLENKH